MNISTEDFIKFVDSNFSGSCYKCAKALNVEPSTVWRVLNGRNSAGIKLLTSIMQYCNSNRLDYNDYIFLTQPLQKSIED